MDRSNIDYGVRLFLMFVLGVLFLLVAVGGVVSAAQQLMGWTFWHSFAFILASVAFVYFVRAWLEANIAIRLDRPVIGIPIVLVFLVIIYQGHFAPGGDPRPVTLAIALAAFAPFFALTMFNLIGLNR